MNLMLRSPAVRRLAIALTGCTLVLSGCNDTIQQTVEDGIISVSTSFLAALFQAVQDVVAAA